MVIVPPWPQALEEQLGRQVHHSQVYRLLARHGWRKLSPDSLHPKADLANQEDWKKNSRRWWPQFCNALRACTKTHLARLLVSRRSMSVVIAMYSMASACSGLAS